MSALIAFPATEQLAGQCAAEKVKHARARACSATVHAEHQNALSQAPIDGWNPGGIAIISHFVHWAALAHDFRHCPH
jgi:hypothetical protein